MAPVRDTQAMIAGMSPVAVPGEWHFCFVSTDDARCDRLRGLARATLAEDEGWSLILDEATAQAEGLASDLPMTQISLQVHSALDGVGLTAAISEVLADAEIPCNIVAGYHHDHCFVPVGMAEEALTLLRARAEKGAAQ
ncbi:MAG: ACT domain-containing protein [Paracoccaceae bacterium]